MTFKALLGKWSCERKGSSLESNYKRKVWGGTRGMVHKEVRAGYGVGVWKAIRKEWNLVADKISFVVGEGNRVLF